MRTTSETDFKARFAEFSGVTQFHGFLELYHSKSSYGKIFWAVIVILGFVVSSQSIYNDMIIFLRHPTATMIKPLDTDEEYYAPKFIFCYPSWIYWVDFHRLKINNISKPALLAGLSFLGDVISETEFDPAEAKRKFLDFMTDRNLTSVGQFYRSIARKAPISFFWSDKMSLNRENQTPYFKKIDIIKQQNTIMLCYTTDSATLFRSLFPAKKISNLPLFSKNDYGVLYKKLNFSVKPVVYEDMSDFVTKLEYNVYISRWLALQTNFILSKDEDYKKDYSQFVLPLLVFPNGYGGQCNSHNMHVRLGRYIILSISVPTKYLGRVKKS
uniref:Uncharacterized protein n=1 Tax=Romanomermis culicivorax TaxID=13658 RepID=A0A915JP25_ROMCU